MDEDISIVGIDNSEAIKKLVVQDKVKGKPRLKGKLDQDSHLMHLPKEIKVMIFSHIPAKSVGRLARSCKAMTKFANQIYVESVILPLSMENQRKLGGRYVLSLTSSVDLSVWEEGQYMAMVRKMNLKQVKRMKVTGPNFRSFEGYFALTKQYVNALAYYVTCGENLEFLDILVDNSKEVLDVIESLSHLPRLREVILRHCGDLARLSTSDAGSGDMNMLINKLLTNPAIKMLSLKGFSIPWEGFWKEGKVYMVKIKSTALETLKIEFSKCFGLGLFDTPSLREISVSADCWAHCLYHSDPVIDPQTHCPRILGMGERAALLAQGCPRLERYNDLELELLDASKYLLIGLF